MTRFKHLSPGVLISSLSAFMPAAHPSNPSSNPSPQQQTSPNVFDPYLATDIPPADGFDFPVGDANASGPYNDIATGIEYQAGASLLTLQKTMSFGIHTGED